MNRDYSIPFGFIHGIITTLSESPLDTNPSYPYILIRGAVQHKQNSNARRSPFSPSPSGHDLLVMEMKMQPQTEQLEKMNATLARTYTDINTSVREALDAALQSATVWNKSCGEFCENMASLLQSSLEQNSKVSQTMMSAKSLHEVMEMQASLMRGNFDNVVSSVGKISQISARTAQQVSEPMTNHINATIRKVMQSSKAA